MSQWIRACGNASCIEVRAANGDVAIRVSSIVAVPEGTIWCTEDEWRAFVAGVKNGEFDAVLPDD